MRLELIFDSEIPDIISGMKTNTRPSMLYTNTAVYALATSKLELVMKKRNPKRDINGAAPLTTRPKPERMMPKRKIIPISLLRMFITRASWTSSIPKSLTTFIPLRTSEIFLTRRSVMLSKEKRSRVKANRISPTIGRMMKRAIRPPIPLGSISMAM
eukprot:XP_001706224.1 Hypothetical protein GL50803_95139 [Giardia lamblia ATCC 50803]